VLFSLLERVGSLFDKRFLFASVLPVLILFGAVVFTLVGVVGMLPTTDWLSHISSLHLTLAATVGTGALIVFSYITGALHSVFVSLWSGTLAVPVLRVFLQLGEARYGHAYESLRADALRNRSDAWRQLQAQFRVKVRAAYAQANHKRSATNEEVKALRTIVEQVNEETTQADIEVIWQQISASYETRDPESLTAVYSALNQILDDRIRRGDQVTRSISAQLDRSFGGVESIRATRLGNLIEAYESYPYKRYHLEGVVFWPALRGVIPQSYLQVLQDSETFVDFATVMATFSAGYAALAAFVGPWLFPDAIYWLLLTSVGCALSYGFYLLASSAASQYGDIRRACVDLFRLDLMHALYRPHPANLEEERSRWREVSQLSIYGEVDHPSDFSIRPRN